MRAALLVALAAAAMAITAPEARAGNGHRITAVGSTPARPFGDGVHLVYTATPQRIVSLDPRAHRATSYAFDGSCAVIAAHGDAALRSCELPRDASDGGAASYPQPYVLALPGGRLGSAARTGSLDAASRAGAHRRREHLDAAPAALRRR